MHKLCKSPCVLSVFCTFSFSLFFVFFWDLCRVRLPETPRKFLHLGHHPHAEIFHRPLVVCTGTGRHQIHVRASGGRNPSAATYFLPDRCQYQKIQSGFRYIRLFFQFQKEKFRIEFNLVFFTSHLFMFFIMNYQSFHW